MSNAVDLWLEVGNKCLKRASELLDNKATPITETSAAVKQLVEAAVMMDDLNLRWAIQNRSGAAASQGQPFSPREAKS